MQQNPTETIAVRDVRPGDTVIIDGVTKTIGREYIKHDPFMGASIYGDCRVPQGRTVEVMLFPKWSKGKCTGYVRQR